MLAYIKGKLEMKLADYVVIDVNGLGYKIFMSEPAMERLGDIGDTVKVHTFYRVREDDISIFGFNNYEELRMFELLISVSGVGAKTAVAMLACITPSEFAMAVISNDITKLVQIPGIGKKSAERIILELKDKLNKDENISKQAKTEIEQVITENKNIEEAMSALQVLGYTRREIENTFRKMNKQDLSIEELIKKALSILSK